MIGFFCFFYFLFLVLGEVCDQVVDGNGFNVLYGLLLFLFRMLLIMVVLGVFGVLCVFRLLKT